MAQHLFIEREERMSEDCAPITAQEAWPVGVKCISLPDAVGL